jgi:hypothetical protein
MTVDVKESVAMFRFSVLLMMFLSATALAAETKQPSDSDAVSQADELGNASGGAAKIYRTVDEQGRPVFTDAPDHRRPAEEVRVNEGSTVQMVQPKIAKPEVEKVEVASGYEIAISSPTHEQTLNNPEVMRVTIKLAPAPAKGHRLRLLDNGNEVPVLIEWPDRGEHKLVAQVVDKGGKVLAESQPVVVYVQRVSLLNKVK